MGIEDLKQEAIAELTPWQRHRFLVMIVLVLVVSMTLVAISLSLYTSSGAAQVDLSLPSYQAIQKQASQEHTDTTFPSNGQLDAEAFDSFHSSYQTHLKRIDGDNYDSRPLDPDSLQLLNEVEPEVAPVD